MMSKIFIFCSNKNKEFLEIYVKIGQISIDGCKRERYMLKIQEMESEIADTYKQLQEEEKIFVNQVSKDVKTIKELLLKAKNLEESKNEIETELKLKEKTMDEITMKSTNKEEIS